MSNPSERLLSLDAFRGLTMALMVIVNTAGSSAIYYQFAHASWHGWTVADTIFPSFIWIVGLAITLVLGRKVENGVPRSKLVQQALRRSAILFALGLLVYVAPRYDLSTQRILGVLQRIAICYLTATLVFLFTSFRTQIILAVALLTTYWMLLTLGTSPGFATGDMSIAGNFSHYVDRIMLGAHNYADTRTWDPEGVLSTLPAIATALMGLLAGYLLRWKRDLAEKVVWFLVIGNSLLFVGLVCDIWMPINKHLWTSSFVIFMAGLDFVVFGMMLWVVDGCGYKRAARPLAIMGMNAIAVYMLSELGAEALSDIKVGAARESLQHLIFRSLFLPLFSGQTAALLYGVAFMLLMYAFAHFLYRRKWFLRV